MAERKKAAVKPAGKKKASRAKTTDLLVVRAYPACSHCETPYVLRYAYAFDGKVWAPGWVWQLDCKHKHATATIVETPKER